MSTIDVEALLQEISPDTPCGEDLEYDAAFGELERSAQGKEEQQIGDTIIEGEEPDWRNVQKLAVDLFSRTKDIRVALYLIRAHLNTEGFTGLKAGLELLSGLLERYWDTIYPELDAEDNNDPTMRINALVSLCDEQMLLNPVRKAPLVNSRMMGKFSLRDIAIASGELQPKNDTHRPEMNAIDAAFMDAELEGIQAMAEAVGKSIEYLSTIENYVTNQVGAANAASFAALDSVLKDAQQTLSEQLVRRGVDDEAPTADSPEGVEAGTIKKAASISGSINNREDVIRALDKIRDYYISNEPTSPLPILMERAKKLVSMSFMEIIENMAPDGLSQIETIKGPDTNTDE